MSVNKVMGVYIDCVGFEDAVYAVQHMLARLIFEAYSNLEACVAGIHTTYSQLHRRVLFHNTCVP